MTKKELSMIINDYFFQSLISPIGSPETAVFIEIHLLVFIVTAF